MELQTQTGSRETKPGKAKKIASVSIKGLVEFLGLSLAHLLLTVDSAREAARSGGSSEHWSRDARRLCAQPVSFTHCRRYRRRQRWTWQDGTQRHRSAGKRCGSGAVQGGTQS